MKFRYLGDKEDMMAFGCDFSNGNEPDVTDEKAIAKLSGNSHFEAVEGDEDGEETADKPKKRGRKPKAE